MKKAYQSPQTHQVHLLGGNLLLQVSSQFIQGTGSGNNGPIKPW